MTSTEAPPPRGLQRLRAVHPKYWVSALITLILVLGQWQYAILDGYGVLIATLASCLAAEWALAHWVARRPASLQSAYISGISLTLLLKAQGSLVWPFVLGALISIGSKFVLRYRGRHLWNPSNFGICVLLLVAPAQVSILSHQFGNELATNAVIWFVGLLVASRARVLHITFTYACAFVALSWLRAQILGTPFLGEVAPLTGPMYQLLVFFMLTDPRTTVSTRRGRITIAILIAVVEAGIRFAADAHTPGLQRLYPAPPLFALFLVGPAAMWLDRRRKADAA